MAADPTSTPEWEVLPEDDTKTTEVASEEQVSLPVEESRNDIASESADAAIDSFIEKSQAAEEEPLLETDTEVIDSTKCQNPGDLAGFVGTSLRRIGDVVKDIDNKHSITQKTKSGLAVVGNNVKDIDNKLKISQTTKESLAKVGSTVTDFDNKLKISQTTKDSLAKVGSTVTDFDNKHKISQKTKDSFKTIQTGAGKLTDGVKKVYIDNDIGGKTKVVGENIKTAATAAGKKVGELNEDGKVTKALAAAAVVGAGVLMANGQGREGATVLATGGAAYVASEALKKQRQHDEGLNEDLHLE